MVATLKEKIDGNFYCSECRMCLAEPATTCPFCGSMITNYEEVVMKMAGDSDEMEMSDINPNITSADLRAIRNRHS